MNILGVLQVIGVVLLVLGVVLVLLGVIPPTSVQFGHARGWGVVMIILGVSMLLIVVLIPAVAVITPMPVLVG